MQKSKSLNFSGHETFPFRQMWAYKASHLFENSKTKQPFTKEIEKSITAMGLGKNMIKSISFWIRALGLFDRSNDGKFFYTDLGKILLKLKNGDPYLERLETIWILHYHLVTNPALNSTLYWIFNVNISPIFTFEDYWIGINEWAIRENIPNSNSQSTLKKDFNVCLGMYTKRKKNEDIEDIVQYPFWPLGLIKEIGGSKQNYQIIKRNLADVPLNAFIYALLKFGQEKVSSISFEELINHEKSPGRAFQLTEYPLRQYLDQLEKVTKGAYVFSETAGMKQVLIHEQIDPNEFLKKKVYR